MDNLFKMSMLQETGFETTKPIYKGRSGLTRNEKSVCLPHVKRAQREMGELRKALSKDFMTLDTILSVERMEAMMHKVNWVKNPKAKCRIGEEFSKTIMKLGILHSLSGGGNFLYSLYLSSLPSLQKDEELLGTVQVAALDFSTDGKKRVGKVVIETLLVLKDFHFLSRIMERQGIDDVYKALTVFMESIHKAPNGGFCRLVTFNKTKENFSHITEENHQPFSFKLNSGMILGHIEPCKCKQNPVRYVVRTFIAEEQIAPHNWEHCLNKDPL